MKKFYFITKFDFYAMDIYANNIREAKRKIREFLGVKTLHGVQVWE